MVKVMHAEQHRTVWEKLGAAEGLWAAALLTIQLLLMRGARADASAADADYAGALLAERMTWEWITLLRLVAGLMIIWWMGSLAGRLRLVEGEPGRLATIAQGIGVAWGAVWLLAGFLNSAAILLAADYANPAGARIAGALAIEAAYVLTPSIVVALMLSTALVARRFGGFPRWYGPATLMAGLAMLALALVDWYGTGGLSEAMLLVGLAWMALTSALLIPTYKAPDLVAGTKGRVAS